MTKKSKQPPPPITARQQRFRAFHRGDSRDTGTALDPAASAAVDPGPSSRSRKGRGYFKGHSINLTFRKNSSEKLYCDKCHDWYKVYSSEYPNWCGKCPGTIEAEVEAGSGDAEGYDADYEEGSTTVDDAGEDADGEGETGEDMQEGRFAFRAELVADGYAPDFETLGEDGA